jgi:peptidoglycan/xylan/chitin deacetylase (PgdA/CDA1 family)
VISVAVTVCTRAGADVAPALAALEAAGAPQPTVVRAAAGHGLALARNAALAACSADVLAFVDDDVVVGPGWAAALRAAWAAAPDHVGAIGGPLAAEARGRPPPWLADDLLAVAGASPPGAQAGGDRGGGDGGPVAVDPAERTLRAGNLSLRVAAARGAGGFWPVRGHPDARDWFTEEHELQRELGRLGWELREDPALLAARVVDAGALRAAAVLGRYARAGARAAALGQGPDRRAAAAGAARAAAGAAVAAARRDPALALQRAARAAEAAGAVAGAPLVHGELQPAARDTPFLHAVAPPARRLERRWRGRRATRPLIVVYHRVCEVDDDPLGLAVSPDRFRDDLELIAARRTPVTLEDVAGARAPRDAVAVTFDDGYADNLTRALPLLEEAGVPATVFVSTGHVEHGRPFWWDELPALLGRADPPPGAEPLTVTLDGRAWSWAARTAPQRAAAARRLLAWLPSRTPEEVDAVLDAVAAWGRAERAGSPRDRPLTRDELARLAASPLVTIGSHARTHPSLAVAEPARRDAELRDSRADLERWLGTAPTAFAYPFGVWGTDVDPAARDAAARAGYRIAVTNSADAPRGDPLALPRVPAAGLRAALRCRSSPG